MMGLAPGVTTTRAGVASMPRRAAMFAAAQRRLEILEKWFIPIFSASIAAYEIAVGLFLFKAIPSILEFRASPPFLLCAVYMTAVAFVCFLVSRYATGMSAEPTWKPLRAGGSFLLGLAVLCFALAIALALANFQKFEVLQVLNYVAPIWLTVLGVETGLNVILDIYRPRLKGEYSRTAFDSRLLGDNRASRQSARRRRPSEARRTRTGLQMALAD